MVTLQWCKTLPSPFSYSLRPGNHICCLATALWQYHNLGVITIKMLWLHSLAREQKATVCACDLAVGAAPAQELISSQVPSQGGPHPPLLWPCEPVLGIKSQYWSHTLETYSPTPLCSDWKMRSFLYLLTHFWQNSIYSVGGIDEYRFYW